MESAPNPAGACRHTHLEPTNHPEARACCACKALFWIEQFTVALRDITTDLEDVSRDVKGVTEALEL